MGCTHGWLTHMEHMGHGAQEQNQGLRCTDVRTSVHRITAQHSHSNTGLGTRGMLASLLPLWCIGIRLDLCIEPQVHDGVVLVGSITTPVSLLQKRHSQLKRGAFIAAIPRAMCEGYAKCVVSELRHARLC